MKAINVMRTLVFAILGGYLFLFSMNALAQNVPLKQVPCHVLLGKQCINLIGKWYVNQGKDSYPDTLIIDSVKKIGSKEMVAFSIEVLRKQSITSIVGKFELKEKVGVFSGNVTPDPKEQCTLVFVPISIEKIEVTSFGRCDQGFRAYPDGTYQKNK